MNKNILLLLGASSDIGLKLIEKIEDDMLIIAHCHNSDKRLLELKNKINNELIILKANFSKEHELVDFIQKVETAYGIPTKIVHLAAPKFQNVRFKDIVWDNFQDEIDISLKSIILILKYFLPKMAKMKRGKVVIMLSSVVINVPPKALVQYTTIKYAILGLVKSIASEYANKNIQINSVSPSMVETKFLKNIDERLIELTALSHPLKRNAKIEEITPILKMLLSEDSDFINGVNIPITGGDVF